MVRLINIHYIHIVSVKYDRLLILILLLVIWQSSFATHNRAGEITYEQIGDVTIRATITTYTRTSSISADRDSLVMFWGDGTSSNVKRINGNGTELENDIKLNIYVSEHTYPTRGTYTMYVVDPNRIANILNIDFPNSVNIQFYLETTFTLLDPRFQGLNNSVILLQPPIDYACPNQPFTYNPNAYDKDGDSIAYELVVPFQAEGVEVPNYQLPDQVSPGSDNKVSLNQVTGDFLWETPKVQGEFNITYRIKEYRDGVLINSLIRDMQILVRSCPQGNNAPTINVVDEICVLAGEVVRIPVSSFDIDSNEVLTLTVLGGPFLLINSPAMFTVDPVSVNSQISGMIEWATSCDHISEEYYQIVIKSTDVITKPRSGLAALRTIRIKIIGPAPAIREVVRENNEVELKWDKPYSCEDTEQFQGFSVWRKEGSDDFEVDSCIGGLENSSYAKIIFLTADMDLDYYFALDSDLDRGKIYCYRVVAEFGRRTPSGGLFNRSASLPSQPVCLRSTGDEPLMLKVSIVATDVRDGMIDVEWSLPDFSLIDTTELIGPYEIQLYQSNDLSGNAFESQPLIRFMSSTYGDLIDTMFSIANLNTKDGPYSFRTDFVSGNVSFASQSASSIFLSGIGLDEGAELNWIIDVPWSNYNYIVYDVTESGSLRRIDSTQATSFTVENLVNGEDRCFVIEGLGRYGLSGIQEPLRNFSNELCVVPMDLAAPCQPVFVVETVCQDPNLIVEGLLTNYVSWAPCLEDDLEGYRIYYTALGEEEQMLIAELSVGDLYYEHELAGNIAGCYSMTSIDKSGNESDIGVEVCVDNCPSYILPNAFTPNSDQSNDVFRPIVNIFIDRVEFEVYNRWGQKVWSTNDPQINWDGSNFSNRQLAEGVYFYICRVFESRVSGVIESEDVLKGSIQLMR